MQLFMWISLLVLGAVSVALVSFYVFIISVLFYFLSTLGIWTRQSNAISSVCRLHSARLPGDSHISLLFRKMHQNYDNFEISGQRQIYVFNFLGPFAADFIFNKLAFVLVVKDFCFTLIVLVHHFDTVMTRS